MAHVYILRSKKDKRFYIGSTNDLGERLKRHNSGYEKATRPYRPYEIVFKQECLDIREARALEQKIKRWKKRELIQKIINSGSIY